MGDLVFVSGDFCSGSTLLFTLFRETQEYYCLYEPLHPRLREYLIWPLRVYEHHYFVDDYFREYRGFNRIGKLFQPQWAVRNLHLDADDKAEDLYRYLSYLIDTAFGRSEKVMLKFNRATFRLPWLRAKFPFAKIIHIHRDQQSQWKSIVSRAQEHVGREDIGQGLPTFEGFNIHSWCEDLKQVFPELAVEYSRTGFERFSKLHGRSLAAHQASSDYSVEFRAFCKNFENLCAPMFRMAGCSADPARLKPLIIQPHGERKPVERAEGLCARAMDLMHRFGRKYASARVHLQDRYELLTAPRLSPLDVSTPRRLRSRLQIVDRADARPEFPR